MSLARRPIVVLPQDLQFYIQTLRDERASLKSVFGRHGIALANRSGSLHDYPITEDAEFLRLPRGATQDCFVPFPGNNCVFWNVEPEVYLLLLEDCRHVIDSVDVSRSAKRVPMLGLLSKEEFRDFLTLLNSSSRSWLLTDMTDATLVELGFATREELDQRAAR